MCDYSLMGVPNRLAREGEDLVVSRFKTGSLGMTPLSSSPNRPRTQGLWSRTRAICRALNSQLAGLTREPVAVCIPPGARLMLNGIPFSVQQFYGVGPTEEVTFTQLTAKPYEYRDAVRFKNGHEMLLQDLRTGQRVRVLQLSLTDEEPLLEPAPEESWGLMQTSVDFIASRSFGVARRERGRHHD